MAYNFDFSYLKNGAPAVTLSSFGIAFNKGAIESLGTPDQVIMTAFRSLRQSFRIFCCFPCSRF